MWSAQWMSTGPLGALQDLAQLGVPLWKTALGCKEWQACENGALPWPDASVALSCNVRAGRSRAPPSGQGCQAELPLSVLCPCRLGHVM